MSSALPPLTAGRVPCTRRGRSHRRRRARRQPALGRALLQGRPQDPAQAGYRPHRNSRTRARWQPVVRGRRRQEAATSTGITVETRARFGYSTPVGTTDDGRVRRLTFHLPAAYAQRLFDARAGAPMTANCARSSPKPAGDLLQGRRHPRRPAPGRVHRHRPLRRLLPTPPRRRWSGPGS
ncbi:telomere-protecting terminal protein Tpg [Streptomyces sp. NPDC085639]|uniref:telomere-protecting terminal protein Tpg n=1 Tax=Streptomyces sp. NPDC085639 TaxID=3365734 RepID=UPI0037D302AC